MNQDSSTTWHPTLQDDPMLVAGDDDFTNFLQLVNDFPSFDEAQAAHHGFETPMGDLGMHQLAMGSSMEDIRGPSMQADVSFPEGARGDMIHGYAKIPPGANPVAHAQAIQQRHHHAQRQHPREAHRSPYDTRIMVPPTPQSSEMQGAAVRYYHYMHGDSHSDLEAYQRQRDDQMTFTPLVSPAVTPIDPNLRFPEQTVHAEYFSPLTSPAIEAQNSHNTRKRTHPHSSKRPNGSITSPTDPPPETQTLPSSTRNTSKNNNRRPSVTGKAPGRTVRQSPLTKPQARRKHPPLNISSAGLTELAEQSQVVVPSAGLSPSHQGPSTSSDGSGQSSISPEPLSDALMPPPTLPRSAGKSPNIVGKSQGPTGANEPATPATLMRLQNQTSSPQTRAQGSGRIHARENEHMEDMMLPESAASTHSLTPLTIDTSKAVVDDEITPTLSAKTPKLTSTSTPRMSAMRAQVKSPSTDTAHNHKRTESRSGHSTKSRQGSVVSHVSPAIRPKISPSIKPLIPQSTPGTPSLSAETSALYLASKSNYQNILEGTHLPGVSYPEALAENLSSKRTSHKLAEQGRRNRINVALKEMESLLPPIPPAKGKRDRSGSTEGDSGEKVATSSNSKASTVEMAIAYIKALQAELSDTKAKLEDTEKKLAETKSSSETASQSPQ